MEFSRVTVFKAVYIWTIFSVVFWVDCFQVNYLGVLFSRKFSGLAIFKGISGWTFQGNFLGGLLSRQYSR